MSDKPTSSHQPVHVYLDQADWSYLQDGKFPEAESSIRRFAKNGIVRLFISVEHLIETAALTEGLQKRLEYIHNFPNTYLIQNSSADILKQSVESLVRSAQDESYRLSLSIKTQPLQNISLEDLVSTTPRETGILRGLVSWSAILTNVSRSARPEMTSKNDLRRDERFIAAMLRGDKATCRRHISSIHDGDETLFQRLISETALFAGHQFGKLTTKFGYWGALDKTMDPVFHACVMPHISSEIRNNQEKLSKVFKLYQDHKTFSKISLPLAFRCSVYRAIHYNTQYQYQPSDETDKQHILFAAFADVFTCDKRNVSPLRDVIKAAAITNISIVRTGQLEKVVEAITDKGTCPPC